MMEVQQKILIDLIKQLAPVDPGDYHYCRSGENKKFPQAMRGRRNVSNS